MSRSVRPSIALLAAVLAIASARTAAAGPATYALDPVHTRVLFAIDHAGFSQALGTVSGSTGVLRFDPDDWSTATLQAEVPLARADLGDEKWNRAAVARNLLDVGNHPVARFASTRIQPLSPKRACVHGNLELRGITREVVFDVRLNALGRYPLPPFRRTIGFSATATLSRADFGITAWQSVIGDRVELRIEAEATHTRTRLGDPAGDDADDDGESAGPDAVEGKAGKPASSALAPPQDASRQNGRRPAPPEPASDTGEETPCR